MLIIERKDGESIERMVKRYKRKYRNTQIGRELRDKRYFTKPSDRRREIMAKAKYSKHVIESIDIWL